MHFAAVTLVIRRIKRVLRKLRRHILFTIAVIAVAVWFTAGVLFSIVEGLDLLTGLYWALVTIATVGYGDVIPSTPMGRFIASLTIVSGIAVFTAAVSVAAGSIVEAAEKRRKGFIHYRGRGHVVVIGWTPAAEAAIRELRLLDVPRAIVLVTEKAPTTLAEPELEDVTIVRGDPTRRETLLRASIHRASMVIVTTNDDAKTALIVLAVRALNPRARIVAEALHPENVDLIHKAGADIVVPTRHLGGKMLAGAIIEPGAAMFVEDISREERREIELHEIPAKPYAGKRYIDVLLELRKKGLTLVAVRRGGRLLANPSDDLYIHEDDVLLVVSPPTTRISGETELDLD